MITENNGNVQFVIKAGKDFVKSEMPEENAKRLFSLGIEKQSADVDGFPVKINDMYFKADTKGIEKDAPKKENCGNNTGRSGESRKKADSKANKGN